MKLKICLGFLILWPNLATAKVETSKGSVEPGSQVMRMNEPVKLYSGSLKVGDDFTPYLKQMGLKSEPRITIVSIVPSIDTKVCEQQSHILSETSELSEDFRRIVISRDTPMAQKRFAQEAKLANLEFGSDFKFGTFGKETGLLMKGPELLTRGVLVLNKKGKVAYMQIVDEITKLPDMDAAFAYAQKLNVKS